MSGLGRFEIVTALVVYVVPLTVVAVLLTVVGLGWLALALLGVEAGVTCLTVLARSRSERGQAAPAGSPWLVLLAMVLVPAAVVGIAVLAS